MTKEFGFKPVFSDAGVYVYTENGDFVIAVVYVDDALFLGPNKALCLKMKAKFMKRWECRDLGDAKEFLGMRITRSGQRISIDQIDYLDNVRTTGFLIIFFLFFSFLVILFLFLFFSFMPNTDKQSFGLQFPLGSPG